MGNCASSFLAKSLSKPPRSLTKVKKTPEHYGMKYETIEFESCNDEKTKISGWYIPSLMDKGKKQLIIVTHPMTFSKYGYSVKDQGLFKVTNVEVEFLKSIKHLNESGYEVVTFDFINHGESGTFNKGFCKVGHAEYFDILGCLKNYVAKNEKLRSLDFGFLSHCMGANSTMIAIGKKPDEFEKLKCCVLVQPVSSDIFTKKFLESKYPLLENKYDGINKYVKKFTGLSLEETTPKEYVKDIKVPVLFVQVKNDSWTDVSEIQRFYDNTKVKEKKLFWIEGGNLERFDGYNYFGENPKEMLEWFKKYFVSEEVEEL